MSLWTAVVALILLTGSYAERNSYVRTWLARYNDQLQKYERDVTLADFNYLTNITTDNKIKAMEAEKAKAMWSRKKLEEARSFDLDLVGDDSRRQLGIILTDATPREPELVDLLTELQKDMQAEYGSAQVCSSKGTCQNPGQLARLMATSSDYDELAAAWKGFRDATGPKFREQYENFVKILNIGARENGYPDLGWFWRIQELDDPLFDSQAMDLYTQLRPLYVKLHAYVRHKLAGVYPGKVTEDGPIPAHLLGNMWAQNWNNLIKLVAPYPSSPIPDITSRLEQQGFTVLDVYKAAETFYTSLGLPKMTEDFWSKSMLKRPKDRRAACHGTAFDFFQREDFRIKKCTQLTTDDFVSVHHEMGHIEYFMAYRNQPSIYRSSPNTGFHEAVADISSLSVLTPSYLQSLGLADSTPDQRSYMNFLMEMALRKIAFLPFGLLIDAYRWRVFNGSIAADEYNHQWWKMRVKLQGVMPPVDRSEKDFDAGSKAHIPHNVPYIRYFVSFVAQFQFHQSLCEAAGHRGPLYLCNIANSTRAGRKLRRFMEQGRSLPWPESMSLLTGTKRLDARPLVQYFKPLVSWLDQYIQRHRITPGWKTSGLNVMF